MTAVRPLDARQATAPSFPFCPCSSSARPLLLVMLPAHGHGQPPIAAPAIPPIAAPHLSRAPKQVPDPNAHAASGLTAQAAAATQGLRAHSFLPEFETGEVLLRRSLAFRRACLIRCGGLVSLLWARMWVRNVGVRMDLIPGRGKASLQLGAKLSTSASLLQLGSHRLSSPLRFCAEDRPQQQQL